MSIHLISIGNEILTGDTLNTNSEFLSKQLTKEGYEVTKVVCVRDDLEEMEKVVRESLQEADCVITTGGLGPTFDDETRIALCKIFEDELVLFPEMLLDLEKRFGKGLPAIENQATWPSKAKLLPNRIGTAPGLLLKEKQGTLFALAGVPSQMKMTFLEGVLPHLHQFFPAEPSLEKEFHFALVPETHFDPFLRKWQQDSSLTLGVYPHYGFITIRAKSKKKHHHEMELFTKEIREQFAHYLYSETDPRLELALHEKMIGQKKTLLLAESCTGGKFAARLTAIPGASQYFLGSMVVYSNGAKHAFLDVSLKEIAAHDAVSKECVQKMAKGLLHRYPSDYVVAISGIAGPDGGTAINPVGTVWVCFGHKDHLYTEQVPMHKKFVLPRDLILDVAINWVLAKLVLEIMP